MVKTILLLWLVIVPILFWVVRKGEPGKQPRVAFLMAILTIVFAGDTVFAVAKQSWGWAALCALMGVGCAWYCNYQCKNLGYTKISDLFRDLF
ncbi:MAG: hypothetical protein Q4E62_04465 [Sutterellaceae bacterium]|nr:hypothetical protein [Sutterellaceae bacterium]